jgi:hypothetical protein
VKFAEIADEQGSATAAVAEVLDIEVVSVR